MLGLPSVTIPPRRPRHKGRHPDPLSPTREKTYSWICERVKNTDQAGPFLIIADSTIDESAAVATEAAVAAAALDSGRVTRGLRTVARQLGPYRGEASVDKFLALV